MLVICFIDSWVVVNTEAQDNADNFSDEVETLRSAVARHEEERKLLRDEITQLKEMLKREVVQADAESKRNTAIIADYKRICQRLDDQLSTAKTALNELRVNIIQCVSFIVSNRIVQSFHIYISNGACTYVMIFF